MGNSEVKLTTDTIYLTIEEVKQKIESFDATLKILRTEETSDNNIKFVCEYEYLSNSKYKLKHVVFNLKLLGVRYQDQIKIYCKSLLLANQQINDYINGPMRKKMQNRKLLSVDINIAYTDLDDFEAI